MPTAQTHPVMASTADGTLLAAAVGRVQAEGRQQQIMIVAAQRAGRNRPPSPLDRTVRQLAHHQGLQLLENIHRCSFLSGVIRGTVPWVRRVWSTGGCAGGAVPGLDGLAVGRGGVRARVQCVP